MRRAAAASLLLLAGCGALGPRVPTLSQGHLGQLVSASSSVAQGGSLIEHAHGVLDAVLADNAALVRELDAGDFIDAKRKVFDMAEEIDPRGEAGAGSPGLDATLAMAIYHLEQAARTDDASEAVRERAPRIAGDAERLLEEADTLTTYINFGLGIDSAQSLSVIAEEIDRVAHRLSGRFSDDGYGVDDLRADLEVLLAEDGAPLAGADRWYLENFERIGDGDRWRFAKKPPAERRDIFSNRDGLGRAGPSGGGSRGGVGDDDDDDGGGDDDD